MSIDAGGMVLSSSEPSRCQVSSVTGTCRVRRSHLGSISARVSDGSTPSARISSADSHGSYPRTLIPKPWMASRATSRPIRPIPTMPICLPNNSCPVSSSRWRNLPANVRLDLTKRDCDLQLVPCRRRAQPPTLRLALGVTTTGKPLFEAVSTATLSTPTPWRAITRRAGC